MMPIRPQWTPMKSHRTLNRTELSPSPQRAQTDSNGVDIDPIVLPNDRNFTYELSV